MSFGFNGATAPSSECSLRVPAASPWSSCAYSSYSATTSRTAAVIPARTSPSASRIASVISAKNRSESVSPITIAR
jgi:hypothetical protein